jgi:hypothetical protein
MNPLLLDPKNFQMVENQARNELRREAANWRMAVEGKDTPIPPSEAVQPLSVLQGYWHKFQGLLSKAVQGISFLLRRA